MVGFSCRLSAAAFWKGFDGISTAQCSSGILLVLVLPLLVACELFKVWSTLQSSNWLQWCIGKPLTDYPRYDGGVADSLL